MVRAIMLALTLAGCVTADRQLIYTRADVDAIIAEMSCRNMARTLVQIERCGVRR